jgi:flagellar biosynthesis/type III secretory pathway M-ring protein FliF/YscJ
MVERLDSLEIRFVFKKYLIKSKQSDKKSDAADGSQVGGQNQNLKEEEFVYSKERSEIVYPVGSIEKISAAIVVQETLTKAEKDVLQEFVFNSVGMDAARGDSVSIVSIIRASESLNSNNISSHSGDGVNENSHDKYKAPDYMGFTLPNIIMLSVSCILLIFAFLLFVRALKKSGNNQETISSFEREKLIADLKEWMK